MLSRVDNSRLSWPKTSSWISAILIWTKLRSIRSQSYSSSGRARLALQTNVLTKSHVIATSGWLNKDLRPVSKCMASNDNALTRLSRNPSWWASTSKDQTLQRWSGMKFVRLIRILYRKFSSNRYQTTVFTSSSLIKNLSLTTMLTMTESLENSCCRTLRFPLDSAAFKLTTVRSSSLVVQKTVLKALITLMSCETTR